MNLRLILAIIILLLGLFIKFVLKRESKFWIIGSFFLALVVFFKDDLLNYSQQSYIRIGLISDLSLIAAVIILFLGLFIRFVLKKESKWWIIGTLFLALLLFFKSGLLNYFKEKKVEKL